MEYIKSLEVSWEEYAHVENGIKVFGWLYRLDTEDSIEFNKTTSDEIENEYILNNPNELVVHDLKIILPLFIKYNEKSVNVLARISWEGESKILPSILKRPITVNNISFERSGNIFFDGSSETYDDFEHCMETAAIDIKYIKNNLHEGFKSFSPDVFYATVADDGMKQYCEQWGAFEKMHPIENLEIDYRFPDDGLDTDLS